MFCSSNSYLLFYVKNDTQTQKKSKESLSKILINENDSFDEAEDTDSDSEIKIQNLSDHENYCNIDGIKCFFNHFINEESVSGLLSINNILDKRMFFNEELKDALS